MPDREDNKGLDAGGSTNGNAHTAAIPGAAGWTVFSRIATYMLCGLVVLVVCIVVLAALSIIYIRPTIALVDQALQKYPYAAIPLQKLTDPLFGKKEDAGFISVR